MIRQHLLKWGAASVALFALGWLLWGHYRPSPNTTQGNWSAPPVAVRIPIVERPAPEKIMVLDKKVAAKKLKLPQEITEDPQVEVLQTAEIRTKKTNVQAVAYMDMTTGQTSLLAKEIPKPFLRFENEKEIGIRYGVNQDLEKQGDLYGRLQFLGVGPAKVGLYGEINTKSEGKAMLDLSWEF